MLTVLCLLPAAAIRWGLGLVWPEVTEFVTFFPAVVIVSLACGLEAGVVAIVLAAIISWWCFIPPQFAFFPLKEDHAVGLALFVISSAVILAALEPYARDDTSERVSERTPG